MLNLLGDAPSVLSQILNVILALVVLMFMILVHEAGHYTAGKLLKFKINEFAVGMGPKILSKKKKNGEIVSLRLLPLGGFCAFEGEEEEVDNPQAFNKQKPWKRLIVLFAGAFFNFISAILISVVVFACFGDPAVAVKKVETYAPQSNQQLQVGDIFYEINGKKVYIAGDFSHQLATAGETFSVTVLRGGQKVVLNGLRLETFDKEITGKEDTYTGIGIEINYEKVKYGFGEALLRSVPYCFEIGWMVLRTIGGLITGVVGLEAVGGPFSTIGMASQVVATGFGNVLSLIVMISVNLGVFNLLPVPALDGCKMIFVTIEWIKGKPINRKVENYINGIGFILLLVFVVLIDILKL